MSTKTVTDPDAIAAFIANAYALRPTARALGIGLGRLRGIVDRAVDSGELSTDVMRSARRSHSPRVEAEPRGPGYERRSDADLASGARVIELVTHEDLRTQADVLAYCEVDLSLWSVIECKIVSHKQGQRDKDRNPRILSMVNVTLRLSPRLPDDPLRAKVEVLDFLKTYAPRLPKLPKWRPPSGGVSIVASIPDIHIGKLSDREETGDDYDIDIARRLYLGAMRDLLGRVKDRYGSRIAEIVNLPANDLIHFSGGSYATTSGTRQDSAGIWQRVYRTAREVAVDGVLLCREVAPTKVIVIPDNHARYESFYLGDAIDCYFHADDRVEVDSSPAPQKFHRFGNVLLGFDHGDAAKFPQLLGAMAQVCPTDFAESTYREWLLGHLHKEQLFENEFGMFYRRLPSLSGIDSWHARMGYRNTKTAMFLVYDGRSLIDILYHTPDPEEYRA